MSSTIPAERLREGQQIFVQGNVSFSRLAALVEGEALTKSIEQARKRGSLYPTTVPHTTINLVDAQVLPANPAALTPEEQFTLEKIYPVKTGDNAGKNGFGIDNKSSYLPTVLEKDPENPGQYRQLVLERDLAGGINVTLVLEVFKPAGYEKRGLGLQQVILNEPVKYYSSGVDTAGLAARGIVVNGPIRSVAGADAPATAAASGAEFAAAPANSQADAHGYAVPAPGAQGVIPAPTLAQQAFPVSAPIQAPVAPVAQVAPVAAPVAAIPAAEDPATTIARLQMQLAEQAAATANSGGDSAFGAAPAAGLTPWDVPAQPVAAYQG
jgi:hypothetical protein